jgi:D-beta-D-heptose 7-phosphate kinase/D-beta-D-heptose 1-phosphate adenosyltransferase
VIAHGQQVVRFDHDPARGPVASKPLGRIAAWVRDHVRRFPVVVVSDYGKGVVTPELLRELAEQRRQHGFAYVVDPKRANFSHYRGATVVKPNLAEACEAAGMEIHDRADLDEAGRRLLAQWEADAVLISRGEDGMSLVRPRARPRHFPTAAHQVYDVTGAGDTALAACALALGAGGTLEEAATLANLAAGIVVGKVGTATATTREIMRALRAGT